MHRCHRSGPTSAGRVALIAALLVASGAQGAPRSREQREAEARKACAAGRVEAGIEILAELLTEYSHPNYIYNQARCYQQNGRSEQAISRFKEYLRAAQDITADERGRVERFIKELEAEVQAAQQQAAPPPPPPPAESTAAPPGETAAPEVVERPPAEVKRIPPPPPRSRTLRTAAIALGVVSLAGVATGVVSSLQVQSLEEEVQGATRLPAIKITQNQEKARTYETLQWVGYGVGAAALVGAVVCLILDDGGSAADRDGAQLTGTIGPGGQPGLVLSGRF